MSDEKSTETSPTLATPKQGPLEATRPSNPSSRSVVDKRPDASPSETQRIIETTLVQSQSLHVGPIPPPEYMHAYGEVNPSFPERILAMAEREQSHRHELQRSSLESVRLLDAGQFELQKRGQWFALVFGIVGVAGGITLGAMGLGWAAAIVGATALGAPTVAMWLNRKSSPEDADGSRESQRERANTLPPKE